MGMLAGYNEFVALRKRLLNALRKAAKRDPGKSYEGEMELDLGYPGIYDSDSDIDKVTIRAHFYLIGPYRHYEWYGKTILEAVKKASRDIDRWILEDDGE